MIYDFEYEKITPTWVKNNIKLINYQYGYWISCSNDQNVYKNISSDVDKMIWYNELRCKKEKRTLPPGKNRKSIGLMKDVKVGNSIEIVRSQRVKNFWLWRTCSQLTAFSYHKGICKLYRSSRSQRLLKKAVLKESLCCSLFLIKLQTWRPQGRFYPVKFARFLRKFFLQNISGGCFWL